MRVSERIGNFHRLTLNLYHDGLGVAERTTAVLSRPFPLFIISEMRTVHDRQEVLTVTECPD